MARPVDIVYHWTHKSNLDSIEAGGLDPSHATGELWAVWYCLRKRQEWARDHVASRHKWDTAELVLLRCHVATLKSYRTCWDGVFYTPQTVPPGQIDVITEGGEAIPLREYVRTQFIPLVD